MVWLPRALSSCNQAMWKIQYVSSANYWCSHLTHPSNSWTLIKQPKNPMKGFEGWDHLLFRVFLGLCLPFISRQQRLRWACDDVTRSNAGIRKEIWLLSLSLSTLIFIFFHKYSESQSKFISCTYFFVLGQIYNRKTLKHVEKRLVTIKKSCCSPEVMSIEPDWSPPAED